MVKIKLGDVIDFKNGKSIKKSDGVIPIYGGNGILGYTDKSNFSHTIVVGRVGAYCGSIYVEENSCWVSDNAIAGVPKEGQDLTYLYYVLKSLNLNSKQIGSSQPLITQSMLRDMVVDIEINIEEQKRIANSISIIDQKIQINNQINQELEAMAKTLYDYWLYSLISQTRMANPTNHQVERWSITQNSNAKSQKGGECLIFLMPQKFSMDILLVQIILIVPAKVFR